MHFRGYSFHGQADLDILREIKEEFCYIPLNYSAELDRARKDPKIERDFIMPDGKIVTIGDERFKVPQLLFEPSSQGRESQGIQYLINNAIKKCDIDVRTELWRGIILSGGNTMFKGFAERLQCELQLLCPPRANPRVIAQPNRRYLVSFCSSFLRFGFTFISLPCTVSILPTD